MFEGELADSKERDSEEEFNILASVFTDFDRHIQEEDYLTALFQLSQGVAS